MVSAQHLQKSQSHFVFRCDFYFSILLLLLTVLPQGTVAGSPDELQGKGRLCSGIPFGLLRRRSGVPFPDLPTRTLDKCTRAFAHATFFGQPNQMTRARPVIGDKMSRVYVKRSFYL